MIDIDATITLARSDKENAAKTWKKTFGFHPLPDPGNPCPPNTKITCYDRLILPPADAPAGPGVHTNFNLGTHSPVQCNKPSLMLSRVGFHPIVYSLPVRIHAALVQTSYLGTSQVTPARRRAMQWCGDTLNHSPHSETGSVTAGIVRDVGKDAMDTRVV